jgi:predicted Zn-dependent peptidase
MEAEMKFELVTTKHGMPLYVLSMPHVMSVASGILVFAGTRDENWPQEAGLAHAVEHMLFQGNRHQKNSLLTAEEIEREGGDMNAWTSKEMTFYYNIVPDFAFGTSVRSLAHMMASPLFKDAEIKKEMLNILEEIKRAQDSPSGVAGRTMNKIIYGNHPLGKDTLGTADTVKNFKKEDFVRWHKKYYHPANCTGIVVGNTTAEKALKTFNKYQFGPAGGSKNTRVAVKEITGNKRIEIIEKDIAQANTYLATAIGAARDKSTTALQVYSQMLSGGMSFPLFQEVRDKRGLCYSVGSGISQWSDRGTFYTYVGTDRNRIKEAIDCIKDVIWSNKDNKELFEKAKRALLGSICIQFCSPNSIMNSAAHEIIFSGSPKAPEEVKSEIESVTLSEVTQAVEQYLRPENLSYSMVVPKDTKIEL